MKSSKIKCIFRVISKFALFFHFPVSLSIFSAWNVCNNSHYHYMIPYNNGQIVYSSKNKLADYSGHD